MHSVQECSTGPSAHKTKTAQSVALSPQCYHIRTSLTGKFLIYAVIPPPYSSCWCWYRLGFKIQVTGACAHVIHTYQSVASFTAPAGLPRHRQQLIQQCAEVRKCVRLHVCVRVCAHACVCVGREWGGGGISNHICMCVSVCVCETLRVFAYVKLRPTPLLQPAAVKA